MRWLVVLLLLGGGAGAAEYGADDWRKSQQFLVEGAQLLRRGDNARALARFNSAKQLAPNNSECYYWCGLTYAEQASYAPAAQFAEQATIIAPHSAKAWLLWGQSLMYLGKFPEAKNKLETAYRLDRNNYLTAFNWGRYYFHAPDDRNLNLALDYFRQARESRRDYTPAIFYIGLCQYEKQMFTLASVTLREVLQADPQNAAAHYWLGMIYRHENQSERALDELTQAVRLDPNNYEAHLQIAHIILFDQTTSANNKERFWYHLQKYLDNAPPDHNWRENAEELFARRQRRVSGGQ
ncbi:MAG: tetratricopeptide repeat protein [Planctomycetota bacterium]|jgi:tetratricopeptide (TPR) repeat protein|nr:tetratricopeptide repeat protein [Planctomycetota bacterium]